MHVDQARAAVQNSGYLQSNAYSEIDTNMQESLSLAPEKTEYLSKRKIKKRKRKKTGGAEDKAS